MKENLGYVCSCYFSDNDVSDMVEPLINSYGSACLTSNDERVISISGLYRRAGNGIKDHTC
jgi:hypothetical protein